MARHFQNLEIRTEKSPAWYFFDQKIWFDWLDFQREPEVAKEIAIRNHRRGERVTSDLTVKLAFNSRNVLDVIDVPVCQQQKFGMDIERADPFARTLRCVEQDPSLRRFEQIAIGFKNPAAKCLVGHRSHYVMLSEAKHLALFLRTIRSRNYQRFFAPLRMTFAERLQLLM